MTKSVSEDYQIRTILSIADKNGFRLEADNLNINKSGMDFITTFATAKKEEHIAGARASLAWSE